MYQILFKGFSHENYFIGFNPLTPSKGRTETDKSNFGTDHSVKFYFCPAGSPF